MYLVSITVKKVFDFFDSYAIIIALEIYYAQYSLCSWF